MLLRERSLHDCDSRYGACTGGFTYQHLLPFQHMNAVYSNLPSYVLRFEILTTRFFLGEAPTQLFRDSHLLL